MKKIGGYILGTLILIFCTTPCLANSVIYSDTIDPKPNVVYPKLDDNSRMIVVRACKEVASGGPFTLKVEGGEIKGLKVTTALASSSYRVPESVSAIKEGKTPCFFILPKGKTYLIKCDNIMKSIKLDSNMTVTFLFGN